VIRLKKVLAVAVLVLGVSGMSLAAAPSASALPVHVRGVVDGDVGNDPLCVVISVTIQGHWIGTGSEPVCLT
jgi:hypothetical protein